MLQTTSNLFYQGLLMIKLGLFGIKYSNRNFIQKESCGKNQFNSSFPTSLSAFLEHQGLKNVYLKLNESMKVYHSYISTKDFFE